MDINKLAALPKPPGALRHQRVELTGAQRKAWTETRAALLWQAPNFAHILYTMMSKDTDGWSALFTSEVAIAATDGVNLLLNPEPFFKLSLLERVFVCAHEIAHAMFDHCGQMELNRQRGRVALVGGQTLPYDHKTMNVAQDLVINDMLIRGKVGKYNPDWLHDPAVGTALDSPVTVYERIFSGAEADPSGGGSGGSGEGPPARNGQTGFDQHLRPGAAQGKDPTQARQERNDVEWQSAIRQANQIAKARGKLPSDMERLFEDLLAPKVDWTDRIKGFFARKIGSGSYDWRRPDRRLIVRDIYAPGRSGHNAGLVVIAVDTSGSIGQSELEVFMAEMRGILDDVRPKRTLVMWCDARVHTVDEIDDPADIRRLKPVGGGGTSFTPVFDRIAADGLEPDCVVYLTDLYGSFPDRAPSYPVLWGRTSKQSIPWGDVVDVPLKS